MSATFVAFHDDVIGREWAHLARRRRASKMRQIGCGCDLAMEGVREVPEPAPIPDSGNLGLIYGALPAAIRHARGMRA